MFWKKIIEEHRKNPENTLKILPALLALLLALAGLILVLVLPKTSFSSQRGQTLASFPHFSLQSLANGTFAKGVEQYLSDHFFLKDTAVLVNNNALNTIGQQEFDGVFVLDDRMIENVQSTNLAVAEKNIAAIGAVMKANSGTKQVNFALVPTASEIYRDQLPSDPSVLNQTQFINSMYKQLQETNGLPETAAIDLYSGLASQKSERLFYSTDNRWTSLGAYMGYSSLLKGLGEMPKQLEEFNIEHASYDYHGNLSHRTSIFSMTPDVIDLYHYASGDPVEQVMIQNGEETQTSDSIYFRQALSGSHHESVFLGRPAPLVIITSTVKNGEHLLLFKDSYSNALMQFLSLHYETITLVDLSLIDEDELRALNLDDYSDLLFLYNVGTLLSDNKIFAKLSVLD